MPRNEDGSRDQEHAFAAFIHDVQWYTVRLMFATVAAPVFSSEDVLVDW
jgi:hypothetical protein